MSIFVFHFAYVDVLLKWFGHIYTLSFYFSLNYVACAFVISIFII